MAYCLIVCCVIDSIDKITLWFQYKDQVSDAGFPLKYPLGSGSTNTNSSRYCTMKRYSDRKCTYPLVGWRRDIFSMESPALYFVHGLLSSVLTIQGVVLLWNDGMKFWSLIFVGRNVHLGLTALFFGKKKVLTRSGSTGILYSALFYYLVFIRK